MRHRENLNIWGDSYDKCAFGSFAMSHNQDVVEEVPGNLLQGVAAVEIHGGGSQPASVAQAPSAPGQAVLTPAGPDGLQQGFGVAPAAPSAASTGRGHGGDAASLVVLVQLMEIQLLATKALLDRMAHTE